MSVTIFDRNSFNDRCVNGSIYWMKIGEAASPGFVGQTSKPRIIEKHLQFRHATNPTLDPFMTLPALTNRDGPL
jgi:hypothetical protein